MPNYIDDPGRNHVYAMQSFIILIVVFSSMLPVDKTKASETVFTDQTEEITFITDIFPFGENYRQQIALDGIWEFRSDPNEIGQEQGWHEGKGEFRETVRIPGAPQAQGIGRPTSRQKTFFIDPFWVRRRFTLPAVETGKRVWLRIGGILPAAEIYMNGFYIGYTKSSRTQQRVDVTNVLKAEAENLIAVKVCDFPRVRMDGLWEMAEIYKTWTGVYRPIVCEITDEISIIDTYIQTKPASQSIHVCVTLSQSSPEIVTIHWQALDGNENIGKASIPIPIGQTQAQVEIKLDNFTTWSPDNPKLYSLDMSLTKGTNKKPADKVTMRFGMREIETRGNKFYLNGNPVFINCFGDDQLYPETLCPPADKAWYLARLKRAREYGMNAAKSCVEVFGPEYMEAADEAGILIIQEVPFGLSELRVNRYTITEEYRDYYAKELEGLVKLSRNHASVIAYSMSSEMEFSNQTQDSFDYFSRQLPQQTKKLAPHALVVDCTGYVNGEDTEKGKRITDFYASIHPKWMKEILDETDFETDNRHPTILHEYNWWSNYPHPADKAKYAHTQLIPYWLDTLQKTAKENGQEEFIDLYHKNSLWLQALGRKDGIEYARRNPVVEGYILWLLIDLHQYSEGLLDDFWNPKNVSAGEFLKSNGETVILLANEGHRCLKMGNPIQIPLAVSHYGRQQYSDATLEWKVLRNTAVFQHGSLLIPNLKQGELTQAGYAEINLPADGMAYKLELEAELLYNSKTINTNNWSFWAFPEVKQPFLNITDRDHEGKIIENNIFIRLKSAQALPIPLHTSLVIADLADPTLADFVENGGRCLLLARGVTIENTACYYGDITFYTTFRTIPWNAGTSGNSGTVIFPHPALNAFPHEEMCDLQFLSMISGVLPMEFSPLRPFGVKPIIRVIDHYAANRNNAYMLEFRIGKGNILITTLGILDKADGQQAIYPRVETTLSVNKTIEAEYLLQCLIEYAQSSAFAPDACVPKADFLNLFSVREGNSPKAPKELLKQDAK